MGGAVHRQAWGKGYRSGRGAGSNICMDIQTYTYAYNNIIYIYINIHMYIYEHMCIASYIANLAKMSVNM